jgi:protocatechuate 3,4-dioxygenase alpha subunit
VSDALIEIWQANAAGRFNHPRDTRDLPLDPTFGGFGRAGSDGDGAYWFETIKPGPVPFGTSDEADGAQAAGTMQAPHISVIIHARGMLNHAQTRLYFADEAANDTDPVLALVPADRRATLLAARDGSANAEGGSAVYRFDIVLQGRGETVFFNI